MFKIGDKVKCVNIREVPGEDYSGDAQHLTLGKAYYIVALNGGSLVVSNDNAKDFGYYSQRFIKASPKVRNLPG